MLSKSFNLRNLVAFTRRFGLTNAASAILAEVLSGPEFHVRTKSGTFFSNRDDWAFYQLAFAWPKIQSLVKLVPVETRNPIILDIGANLGLFSLMAKNHLPGSTIHAFEPSSRACNFIRRNVSDDVRINEVCVGDVEGMINFFEAAESLQVSTADAEEAARWTCKKIEKPCVRLDSYFRELDSTDRFVVLKIDVQGYEEQVIRGLGESLADVDMIFLESSWISRTSIAIALELCERALKWIPVNDVLWGADLCLLMSEEAVSLNKKL